ncbi:response regulator [Pedobacter mucosus]|uniref:response regulator n=1 Tax=Pedobacter mucosus TaxID=2895286 RepID=UPI001EE3DB23|nr:response regulator [Pedobacter mucosus]UKT64888.1 response regulator [Pedobacter mucosus]
MSNKKILICDDDAGILDVLELILEETGHIIIPEINSLNVRSVIDKQKPDLIILDLWMPVLSGDQILHMIRRTAEYKDLPVIIISASRDGEQIAFDSSATAFIAKPFDYDNLVGTVQKILN